MSTIDQLRDQFRQVHNATEAYLDELTAKYAEIFPQPRGETGPPSLQLVLERSRAWTKPERAKLDRLRAEAGRLTTEINQARQARRTRP